VETSLLKHRVPGASVAIAEGGETIASYGYGTAQAGSTRPVARGTLFQAASLSKTVNALPVLRLLQTRGADLDDPVNERLKSWRLPDNALTQQTPVTIRMLLSHTGGTTVHGFAGYDRGAPLSTLVQILDGKPPANSPPIRVEIPPGTAVQYSGGGITVLQQMVIDIANEPYPAALKRSVFDPLGMAASRFDLTPPEGICAIGHGVSGEPIRGGWRVHPEMAAAGLWTTPGDLMRALLAIIRARRQEADAILDPRLAREMLKPVIRGAGLGTFIDDKGRFSHSGSNAGFRCAYWADPVKGQAMVAMTNGENGAEVYKELRECVAAIYGWR
jgi:CubicO group peptidase (beta-lactamase class C family)